MNREFFINYLDPGLDLNGCESLQYKDISLGTDTKPVTLEFDGAYELLIDFNCEGNKLILINKKINKELTLGWMDSHQMSDALRCEEAINITRSCTNLPNWASTILLAQYSSPVPDDIEVLVTNYKKALLESDLFTNNEVEYISHYPRSIVRDWCFWIQDSDLGWIAEASENRKYTFLQPYSLRTKNNKDFDFKTMNNFLEYCESNDRYIKK